MTSGQRAMREAARLESARIYRETFDGHRARVGRAQLITALADEPDDAGEQRAAELYAVPDGVRRGQRKAS